MRATATSSERPVKCLSNGVTHCHRRYHLLNRSVSFPPLRLFRRIDRTSSSRASLRLLVSASSRSLPPTSSTLRCPAAGLPSLKIQPSYLSAVQIEIFHADPRSRPLARLLIPLVNHPRRERSHQFDVSHHVRVMRDRFKQSSRSWSV